MGKHYLQTLYLTYYTALWVSPQYPFAYPPRIMKRKEQFFTSKSGDSFDRFYSSVGNYAPQAGNTVPASQKRLGQQNAGHSEKESEYYTIHIGKTLSDARLHSK